MYKLFSSTDFKYESGFVRNQGNRVSQLKGDQIAAERGHIYMMVKMSDLFGFVNVLERIIYGLGFKLILNRNNNDRALFRVNAVADNGKKDVRDISWDLPSIDPSNDNRIIEQKGSNKKKNIDFSYYEIKTFYMNTPNATNFSLNLGMKISQYKTIGFEIINVNDETNDASTFDIMNVTECYFKIGSEFHPEDRMNITMVLIIIMRLLKRILTLIKIVMDYHIK